MIIKEKRKTIIIIVLAILLVVITLLIIQYSDALQKSKQEPKFLTGYMFMKENKIDLDEVEIVEIEDTDRIKELGLNIKNHLPNGYYIYNPTVEIESFRLTDSTKYIFTDSNLCFVKEADSDRLYETTKLEEFIEGSSYQESPLEEQKIPYFIEICEGKVISITEKFIYTQ